MKTSLTLDKGLLAEDTFEVPCFACETMGFDSNAEWVVTFDRPNPEGIRDFFLCDPCLTRWRHYGFGVSHERNASWTRL